MWSSHCGSAPAPHMRRGSASSNSSRGRKAKRAKKPGVGHAGMGVAGDGAPRAHQPSYLALSPQQEPCMLISLPYPPSVPAKEQFLLCPLLTGFPTNANKPALSQCCAPSLLGGSDSAVPTAMQENRGSTRGLCKAGTTAIQHALSIHWHHPSNPFPLPVHFPMS